MILLTHILIALSSVAYTTYLYLSPTDTKFKVTYGFVGATIASGTWLVISTGSPILSSCLTGLAYIGAMSVAIILAARKYAKQNGN